MFKFIFSILFVFAFSFGVNANNLTVKIFNISNNGIGNSIGTIVVTETKKGLLFEPKLSGLPSGERGFHIHSGSSCEISKDANGNVVSGGAALGHYDPENTKNHLGPNGGGHTGDLPVLLVDKSGNATQSVLLTEYSKLKDIKNLTIMIHNGGDNYSDEPNALGGGGLRIACGVIK